MECLWYTKAAEQGHARAQCNLGTCYQDGEGVAQDSCKAVEWYTKAAAQDDIQGMENLSRCYKFGSGVAQDLVKTEELFTKLAGKGVHVVPGKAYKPLLGEVPKFRKYVF